MYRQYEKEAKRFMSAIKTIAANEEASNNLEHYLSHHFQKWLDVFAKNPEDITTDLEEFVGIFK